MSIAAWYMQSLTLYMTSSVVVIPPKALFLYSMRFAEQIKVLSSLIQLRLTLPLGYLSLAPCPRTSFHTN